MNHQPTAVSALTRGILDESRRLAPDAFALCVNAADEHTGLLLADPLTPIDMSTVRDRPYGEYNRGIWTLNVAASRLLFAAVSWTQPGSRYYQSPSVLDKIRAGCAYEHAHYTGEGTCGAPDQNIDRFVITSMFDVLFVMGNDLPAAERDPWLTLLWTATQYQLRTYGTRGYPWKGGYPNMDAAYTLLLAQAAALFDDANLRREALAMLPALDARLVGSTYEYVDGSNPDARYKQVVLNYLGRAWQLLGDPSARAQIARHAVYYEHFVEPGGHVDYAICPPIKHDWEMRPWQSANATLELVNRVAPTPVLRTLVTRMRAALSRQPELLNNPRMIFFLSSAEGEAAPPPGPFLREAAEIAGFQSRAVSAGGTATFYLTGKEVATDTRVGVVHTSPEGVISAFGGVFVEIVRDGVPYFLTDMKPRVERHFAPDGGRLRLTTHLHGLGPAVEPMITGDHMDSVARWQHGCWEGGSPGGPPVALMEEWTITPEGLSGRLTLTAQEAVEVDEIRVTASPAFTSLTLEEISGGSVRAEYGGLAVSLSAGTGPWKLERVTAAVTSHPRADDRKNGTDVRWRLRAIFPGGLKPGEHCSASVLLAPVS